MLVKRTIHTNAFILVWKAKRQDYCVLFYFFDGKMLHSTNAETIFEVATQKCKLLALLAYNQSNESISSTHNGSSK